MIKIGIFELVVELIQYMLMGIWGTLFWVELRHKIDTNWGRWSAILFCWVLYGLYLIFK